MGSDEHKVRRWWGGLPSAYVDAAGVARRPGRQRTTICPLVSELDRQKATLWLRSALGAGQVRYFEADKDFPARVWYREPETGQLWMGYCINNVQGHYKGWPIDEEDRVAVFGRMER
ncbi:MAG TPA: hypothetical protein VMU93_08660 [Caulobacteraceae bacterium]|nr:hypothetical protein [Caulobacteraceae bacterium]